MLALCYRWWQYLFMAETTPFNNDSPSYTHFRIERNMPGYVISQDTRYKIAEVAPQSELRLFPRSLRVVSQRESSDLLSHRGALKPGAAEAIANELLLRADHGTPPYLCLPIIGIHVEPKKSKPKILKISAVLDDAEGVALRERQTYIAMLARIAGLQAPPDLPYTPDITFASLIGPADKNKEVFDLIEEGLYDSVKLAPPSARLS